MSYPAGLADDVGTGRQATDPSVPSDRHPLGSVLTLFFHFQPSVYKRNKLIINSSPYNFSVKRVLFFYAMVAALCLIGCKQQNEPSGDGSGKQEETPTPSNGGVLSGVFTVGKTTKVRFSPGNLQFNAALGSHQCMDGRTKQGTWRFAKHQWDIVGMGYGQIDENTSCYIGGTVTDGDNRRIGSTYDGWIDLFGWGTSGWESGANYYEPWSTSDNSEDFCPGGSWFNSLTGDYAKADWGVYNQIGKDAPGSWRTLTFDEWHYLICLRTNAGYKYGAAKVNGIAGIVVLPDDWTLPSGCSFTCGLTNAFSWRDWSRVAATNIYSAKQWIQMETAGAVFLPAAGCRYGTSVGGVGSFCYYWSSTEQGCYVCILFFGSNDYDTVWQGSRVIGYSVRLVSEL